MNDDRKSLVKERLGFKRSELNSVLLISKVKELLEGVYRRKEKKKHSPY
jgi:hypothetical protein